MGKEKKQAFLVNESKNELNLIFNKNKQTKNTDGFDEISKKFERVNKLKAQILEKEKTLEGIKSLYKEHVYRQEHLYCQTKEKFVIVLVEKYFEKGYTNWQRDLLYATIQEEAELLSDMDYSTEILADMLGKANKHYLDCASSLEKDMAQAMLEEFMSSQGLNTAGKEFSIDDFASQDFAKQFAEYRHKEYFEELNEQKTAQTASKNSHTDIDFQKVYRKLIKLVHPDLFKSEEEKIEKEKLIKRVTLAWENRDYLELLTLKEIIDFDNSIDIAFSATNLKSIVRQLNEKISELEAEKYMISSHLGPNYFYFKNFNAKSEKGIIKKIETYKKDLTDSIAQVEQMLKVDFKNKSSTKKFLTRLYDSREDPFDMDGFFDDF